MVLETLSREQYAREYRAAHDAVFRPGELEDGPFVNPRWRMVLLGTGLYVEEDVFAALAAAARQHGDHEIVFVDREGQFPDQPPVRIAWEWDRWEEARCTVLGHVHAEVFGGSGAWGMVASYDGFCVLGGEESFVAAFEAAIPGGRQAVRDRFVAAAGNGMIFTSETGLRYAARLVAMVGWKDEA
ncbi:MAG TPA: hypothetical protein VLK84_13025 [Longimicrobium sp.]|nr:hypothetical protein [Longimicrobium sp.]